MLRVGRNSRLYFPGDGRAQSSLSWPSFHHSVHSESGTGVKGNVKTWLMSRCRLVARIRNRPIRSREHLGSAIFLFVDRRLLIPSCLNVNNFTLLIGYLKRVGLSRHSRTKFLWRSSPVCRMSRRHVFTSFEAALPVCMLNRVWDWCIDMSKGYLYSHTSVWSGNAPTIVIWNDYSCVRTSYVTFRQRSRFRAEHSGIIDPIIMSNAPLTPVCFGNAQRKVVWSNYSCFRTWQATLWQWSRFRAQNYD